MFTGNAKAIARFCYCGIEHHTSFDCDYVPDRVQDDDSNANRIVVVFRNFVCACALDLINDHKKNMDVSSH